MLTAVTIEEGYATQGKQLGEWEWGYGKVKGAYWNCPCYRVAVYRVAMHPTKGKLMWVFDHAVFDWHTSRQITEDRLARYVRNEKAIKFTGLTKGKFVTARQAAKLSPGISSKVAMDWAMENYS